MSTSERDGAAVRIPPPLVYLAGVVVGALLQRYVYALPIDLPWVPRVGAAVVIGAIGVLVIAAAIGLFKRTDQNPKPWEPTPEIISTGIYGITRNPMYVGLTLIQAAIGLGAANAWIIAFAPVALAGVYLTAVRHEEEYLEAKFGEAYLSYKRSVRRWI